MVTLIGHASIFPLDSQYLAPSLGHSPIENMNFGEAMSTPYSLLNS
jgi:hypothetical protein